MYQNIYIETERLIIRNFQNSELEVLYRIVNDDSIMKYVPFTEARSMEECNELMGRIIRRYSESSPDAFKGFLLLAVSKMDGKPIGFVGLFPATYDTTQIELFYGVFDDFRRIGYAVELGVAVIKYGFSKVGTDRIIAAIDEANCSSRRVAEKMGLHFEYVIKDESAQGSSYSGELLYSITRDKY